MAAPTTADLTSAIVEIREEEIPGIVDGLLASGVEPGAIIDACREAMGVIGQRFEAGEAFIPELIMAGEMMKAIAEQVRPHLGEDAAGSQIGCVVLGTVKGDIHDIGKDLVGSILDAGGFEVVDLGVDVPAERFVAAIGERQGCTVALSCLLTTGFESMRQIITGIAAAQLRDDVRIMVGGAPITAQVCEYVGADGWGSDAATALDLAKRWTTGHDGGR
jgi:5-methyltetrahydrofolate--homocysteine methyltransferase